MSTAMLLLRDTLLRKITFIMSMMAYRWCWFICSRCLGTRCCISGLSLWWRWCLREWLVKGIGIADTKTNQSRFIPPRIVADEPSYPERIAMHSNGKDILVLESAGLNLSNLELMPGVGWPISQRYSCVNGDGANVTYSITEDEEQQEEEPPSTACQKVTKALVWLYYCSSFLLHGILFLNIFVEYAPNFIDRKTQFFTPTFLFCSKLLPAYYSLVFQQFYSLIPQPNFHTNLPYPPLCFVVVYMSAIPWLKLFTISPKLNPTTPQFQFHYEITSFPVLHLPPSQKRYMKCWHTYTRLLR